jgi:hypothetical protein
MKHLIRCTLALAVSFTAAQWNSTSFAQFFESPVEGHETLTIKSDGTCQVVNDNIVSRVAAESQARRWERNRNRSGEMAEDEETPNAQPGQEAAVPKPFTDEELTKNFREMMKDRANDDADVAGENANIEVKKDTVRTIERRSFASIEEMLKEDTGFWWQGGVAFQNARFEKDTNGLLRVTLTPQPQDQRSLKRYRSGWKMSGVKTELKLIFPGKVLSSGFPEMQTNATWLAIDAKKDESLDAALKLFNAPTIITADLAGLKLDQPLDLKKLQRSARLRSQAGEDIPLTDAAPGFVAEAQAVTTTTLHIFPDGENYFKQNPMNFGQQTGAVVNVKFFAPKGRSLQSVSDVRVLKATDDKARIIAASQEQNEENDEETSSYAYSGGSREGNSTQIQLHLPLPLPDAQAIDEISAEAIAVTAGAWKEMTLTNIQENATNELDLAAVLPGAKLVITKFSWKNSQLNIQARIKGPPTVRRLDIQAKIPGLDNFINNLLELNFKTKANESTRTVTIDGYGYGANNGPSTGPVVLMIRYPEDLRRERVNFKLKALDLF